MKVGKILIVVLILVSVMSGCTSEAFEVEDVLDKMIESSHEMSPTTLEISFNADATVGLDGFSMDMAGYINASIQYISMPEELVYTYAEAGISALGMDEIITHESYQLNKENQGLSYSNDGSGWVVEESVINDLSTLLTIDAQEIIDTFERYPAKAIGIEGFNGEECYVIEFKLNDLVQDESLEVSEEVDELALMLEDVNMTLLLYVSKESYTPIAITGDFAAVSAELFEVVKEMEEVDLSSAKLEVRELYLEIIFGGYGEQIELSVPQEIIEQAQAIEPSITENIESEEFIGDLSTQTHVWEDLLVYTASGSIQIGQTTINEVFRYGYEDMNDEVDQSTLKYENGLEGYFGKGDSHMYLGNPMSDASSFQEIEIEYVSFDETGLGLSLSGGIQIGSTYDQIITAYGEPNYQMSEYDVIKMQYENEMSYLYIVVNQGIISHIDIGLNQ